jgi:hypothetical protein
MPRLLSGLFASLLVLAPAALAVVPAPPDQVAFSAIASAAGPYDVTARIYDAASGGTLLYKQSFTAVPEEAQHQFTVNLGPTGAATDSPTNPLTTNLRAALTGDLAAGTSRFVEITVNTDPPLARVALVLVPYAMRADHATTADVANQALDTQAVNGTDGAVLTQLLDNFDEDGRGVLLGGDPREGTADPDGDGVMNFIDRDNDNDGLDDVDEVFVGSTNPNLVTPFNLFLSPTTGLEGQSTVVTIGGTGFQPGLTAVLGSQTFNPGSVTPTSFSITVGPQPAGAKNLTVTNANGEAAARSNAFTFTAGLTTPVPLPNGLVFVSPVQITASGEELMVSGQANFGANRNKYAVDTVVDGTVAFNLSSAVFGISPSSISWDRNRVLYGLRGWAINDQVRLARDANGDFLFGSTEDIVLESPGVDPKTQSPSVTFDPGNSNRPGGGYLRNVGGVITAMAFQDRNGDGLFTGPNELVAIEPVGGATDSLGEAAFDRFHRFAYVYYDAGAGVVRAAWDRSGDGDFDDVVGTTPELVTVASAPTPFCFGMTFDRDGHLAVVFGAQFPSGDYLQLRRDLDGDGDFDDAGEASPSVGATNFGHTFACDIAPAMGPEVPSSRVLVVHNAAANSNNAQPRLYTDYNLDGDYLDANESETLTPTAVNGPFALTKTASDGVRLLTASGVIVGPVR